MSIVPARPRPPALVRLIKIALAPVLGAVLTLAPIHPPIAHGQPVTGGGFTTDASVVPIRIALAINARSIVTDDLSAEKIVGSADMNPSDIEAAMQEAGAWLAVSRNVQFACTSVGSAKAARRPPTRKNVSTSGSEGLANATRVSLRRKLSKETFSTPVSVA